MGQITSTVACVGNVVDLVDTDPNRTDDINEVLLWHSQAPNGFRADPAQIYEFEPTKAIGIAALPSMAMSC